MCGEKMPPLSADAAELAWGGDPLVFSFFVFSEGPHPSVGAPGGYRAPEPPVRSESQSRTSRPLGLQLLAPKSASLSRGRGLDRP